MRAKLLWAAGAVVMSASVTTAFAADKVAKPAAPAKPAVVVVAPQWGGLFLGVNGGFQWSRVTVANATVSGPPGTVFTSNNDTPIFGFQAAAQHQLNHVVLGVDASYDFTGSKSASTGACYSPAPVLAVGGTLTASCRAYLQTLWTVGARLGIAAQNWMPYAAGGYGNGTYHFAARNAAGTTIEQADAILNGWYVGGGLEVMLGGHKNWTFGVDYRHFVFTRGTVNAFFTSNGAVAEPVTFRAHADVVTARVNFHFGG